VDASRVSYLSFLHGADIRVSYIGDSFITFFWRVDYLPLVS
jgi:hypothetical protein